MTTPKPQLGWSLPARYSIIFIGLAAAIAFIIIATPLVGAIITGALLAYLLSPLAMKVSKLTRIPYPIAARITFVLFLFGLIAIPSTLAPLAISRTQSIQAQFTEVTSEVELALTKAANYLNITLPENFISGSRLDVPQLTTVYDVVGNVSTNAAWILAALVITFYLMQDSDKLIDWLFSLSPPNRRDDLQRLYIKIQGVWRAYIRGQMVLMLVIGLASWLAGAALGIPGAFAIGLLAGVLDVVPTIGPAIAMVVAASVSWLRGSTYLPVSNIIFALITLGAFGLIQTAENVWLRPRIMGYSLRLHPAVIFISIIGAVTLGGVLLTLIIIPLIGTISILGRYTHARMLGVDPWAYLDPVSPPTQVK